MKQETIELINQERHKQDEQWGGFEHDVNHLPSDWARFIHYQTAMVSREPYRCAKQRFAKIAALAVAALEALK